MPPSYSDLWFQLVFSSAPSSRAELNWLSNVEVPSKQREREKRKKKER
jgi:hypothetical protein